MAFLACGLGDVFSSTGPEPVSLIYQGPTEVTRDSTVGFTVIVETGGAPLAQPRLRITSSDEAIVALIAGQDSLKGVKVGTARLTIRLESSLFPDTATAPQLTQHISVRP
ncbi:MAG: hypothetical protein ACREMM_11655 [Gemmatimonadales bacterium]